MIDFQYKIILPLDLQMFAKEGPGGEKTEDATGGLALTDIFLKKCRK